MRRLTALLLVLASLGAVACGDDDDDTAQNNLIPEEQTATGSDTEAPSAGTCKEVETPSPRPDGDEEKPTSSLDADKTYEVRMNTNCGSFTITLDQKASPATAASFVSLVRKGFYDGTVFHRIVPGFVIQGGDPTATGSGGPGYSTVDKPPPGVKYTKGVVAMAKAGPEPAGTAGSQFYVVTGEDAGLPADYALLGKVTEGLAVTEKIGELGDPATEMPLETVAIDTAKVSER